jgi:3-oxoacyl-[acyl-carrier-protein] synthase-3
MQAVYITDLAGFLPNAPVDNNDIERVLGRLNGKPSRAMKITLRSNGIKLRHYAIDPATGRYTHNNAQMTAEAVRALLARAERDVRDIDFLACGTSSADQIQPSHASMVHGELKSPPCETASISGVCASGTGALKFAYLQIAAGLSRAAVSTGSEFVSSCMRAANFAPETEAMAQNLDQHPELAFEKDFLRWMLSDGAGAALLRPEPNPTRESLRIDWIDGQSYAGDMDACMYFGAIKRENGSLQGWREEKRPDDALRAGYFSLQQDVRLLNDNMVDVSVKRALLPLAARRGLKPDAIDWFVPHYSSEYFRPRLQSRLVECNFPIAEERWFSNLATKGNVGSAAIYVMLEELLYSGRLKKGDRVLCFVPESSRFTIYFMHLTVV